MGAMADDLGFRAPVRWFVRIALVAAVLGAGVLFRDGCGNDDDSLSDCSRRGKPQYRDSKGDWTCR